MKALNVDMAPFNSTMMGMLRGIADYYQLELSDAMLFGASGHAFVLNIHNDLCPSGPYCWDRTRCLELVRNLGIEVTDLGFFNSGTEAGERARIEAIIRTEIDGGRPCGLINMEFQVIAGYDDTGFLLTQPWPGMDFPPNHLTWGTWAEMGNEVHVNFFTFGTTNPASLLPTIEDALDFAVSLYERPSHYCREGFAMGPQAYRFWKDAIKDNAQSHGNWWNAMVYSEGRIRAGEFLTEVAEKLGEPLAVEVGDQYTELGRLMQELTTKETSAEAKFDTLLKLEALEAHAVHRLGKLLGSLRSLA